MTLYKYLTEEHAISMVENGIVRIGTLYEFRDIERHGGVRGDEEEGVKSTHLGGPYELSDNSSIPEFLKGMIKIKGGAKIKEGKLTNITRVDQSPNFYIYCTSKIYNKTLKYRFGGACVEITDYHHFFRELLKTLNQIIPIKEVGLYDCIYTEKSVDHTNWSQTHPALMKPPRYSEECEVRALWQPIDLQSDLKPQIFQCKTITQHCKIK